MITISEVKGGYSVQEMKYKHNTNQCKNKVLYTLGNISLNTKNLRKKNRIYKTVFFHFT